MDSTTSPKHQEPDLKKPKMSITTTSDDEPTTNPSSTNQKPRYKRRKIAIFFAYCGVGYQGMQKNPGAKTIEGELEEALYHSGAVPEHDRGKPKRFDWARSARTDKGVSAVGQVVSGRFYIDPPGFIDRLNSNLPNQIRIFGFKRVTSSFNAKKFCDRRRYVYLIPVFALDCNSHPDRESVLASLGSENELVKCLECSERGRKVVGLMGRNNSELKIEESLNKDEIESGVCLNSSVVDVLNLESVLESGVESKISLEEENLEANLVQCSSNGDGKEMSANGVGFNFGDNENRVEKESVLDTESVLESGVESKISLEEDNTETNLVEFSNGDGKEMSVNGVGFTYGEKEKEKFNRILNYYVGTHNFHNFTTRTKAEDPSAKRYIISFTANSVVNVQGMNFVKCEVVGQSFMLHQIRKMIGLAVAIMRNCAQESLIEMALQQDVNINVPTAPEVGLYLDECFFTSYNQKWKDSHEEISMEVYAEQAEDFKMKQVYSHIASTEQKEGAVAVWLHSLNHRNYPDLRFVGPDVTCTNGDSVQVDSMAE